MFADLLRIRRWYVERKSFGYAAEVASWHFTEAGAKRRKVDRDARHASHLIVHTVRHQPRRVPGLLDPTAAAHHRAPGRPA